MYPDNREPTPRNVPLNPMASLPAIARFVWGDQEEWRPVIVNRWVDGHVLILFRVDPADPRSETGCWLSVHDVRGAVRGSVAELGPTWGSTMPPARR